MSKSSQLDQAVQDLVNRIQTYESDTFSASELELKPSEATEVAALLIRAVLVDETALDAIDGAVLDDILDRIRG